MNAPRESANDKQRRRRFQLQRRRFQLQRTPPNPPRSQWQFSGARLECQPDCCIRSFNLTLPNRRRFLDPINLKSRTTSILSRRSCRLWKPCRFD